MRTFRLKKIYPGSPTLGQIYTTDNVGNCKCAVTGKDINIAVYSEFWEELIEKKYEILTLNTNSYFGITKSSLDIDAFENGRCKDKNYTINSIKRLSDGEIFTIGDKIKDGFLTDIIKNDNNDIWLYHNGSLTNVKLEDAIISKVLFTTEDGVEIFKGDYCSHVNIKELTLRARTRYNTGESYSPKTTKYFSTEEKAEEYILMNKPCLSINDVKSVYHNQGMLGELLKKLVKQKL